MGGEARATAKMRDRANESPTRKGRVLDMLSSGSGVSEEPLVPLVVGRRGEISSQQEFDAEKFKTGHLKVLYLYMSELINPRKSYLTLILILFNL